MISVKQVVLLFLFAFISLLGTKDEMETTAPERFDCFVQSAIAISRALIETDNDEKLDSDHQRIFSQIAANLQRIHHVLESFPVYWIQGEVKTLYKALLENFDYINSVRL